ncbi:MAG: hypothetical protein PF961_22120 [Planctomycetota bacterium]|jgi:hypothetical protein|nr:hypothetical protein [Planctomycetota bacterium]
MNDKLLPDLINTMNKHGFRQVADTATIPTATLLLKRQTWNTNRAIVVVSLDQTPDDFHDYLKQLRRSVAFKCRFFPYFWGIGIQAIIVAPGISNSDIVPSQHVAVIDNQWAIIQSIFLADPADNTYQTGRTWGQLVTGKFQDAISNSLSHHFEFKNQ